jgi:hypothetical protein
MRRLDEFNSIFHGTRQRPLKSQLQPRVARPHAHTTRLRVRGFRWICSIVPIATAAVLFVLDIGRCAKRGQAGGLSKLKSCRLAGIDEELLCGRLTVFENRNTRTGRTLDLNVVVPPAVDQKTKAEPLFDLAGGRPGGPDSTDYSSCGRRRLRAVPKASDWAVDSPRSLPSFGPRGQALNDRLKPARPLICCRYGPAGRSL